VKLVTYDRRGHRRLGALLGDRVVDVPDLVGHPAFPVTMEALVTSNGGTVLDAARAALQRDDAEEHVVPGARLLVPLLPSSLRDFVAFEQHVGPSRSRRSVPAARAFREMPLYHKGNHRAVAGPEEEIPWPRFTKELDYELEVAAVVGRYGRDLEPAEAESVILGYTLMNDWSARDAERKEMRAGLGPGRSKDFATSLGPCIVTPEEVDPHALVLVGRVDGEVWSEGTLAGARWSFPEMIAHVSWGEDVWPGDVYGSGTFVGGCGADLGRRLRPGVVVQLESEGIGVLRNRVGKAASVVAGTAIPRPGRSARPRAAKAAGSPADAA
jgi:2-keto-4-pentenoate hydratase/2-oxohepta-3-ene-1,7-dioic acid hydratase in catechol pathway